MKTAIIAASAITLTVAAPTLAQTKVFDNITGNLDRVGTPNAYYAPSNTVVGVNPAGTGNRYVGQALNLAASGPTAITGFDAVLANSTGAAMTAGTQVRLSYWIWGSWNSGATGAQTVFSSLLHTGTFQYTLATNMNNGTFRIIQAATPGSSPAITLAAPVELPENFGTIGVTFAWQRLVDGQWTWVNGLTSGATGGTSPAPTGVAPIVGSLPNQPLSFYYRSNDIAGGDVDGQFLASSARNFGTSYSSMTLRVYAIPTPAAGGLLAAAGAFAVRRRRR